MSGSWAGGQGQRRAITLGLAHVNDRDDILPGYRLALRPEGADDADTQCNGGTGTDVMYRELYNKSTTKIMVLGAGCSIVTQPTAQASHLWNLLQLSYSSASPKLSERDLFPKFFRMFPPETVFNVVKFEMLRHFRWRKVATLHQTIELFSLPTADFLHDARSQGVEIIASESFSEEPSLQVSNLKKQGARIIIGNFYENRARQVFCEAYKNGLYGEKYVWIITGWYSNEWWRANDPDYPHDCTTQQMDEAVAGYFTTDALPLSLATRPGVSGKTTEEFWEEYSTYVGGNPESLSGHQEAPYGYDSVWTIALMLQEAEDILQKMDPPRSIADFSYEDDEIADLFYVIMNKTNFEGVSGPVQFTAAGDRKGLMQVERQIGDSEVRVGIYDPSARPGEELQWSAENPIIWEGGRPPADSVIERETRVTVSLAIFIVMTTLAIFGIFLAVAFLAFNIKYRTKRYIKMSSPKMNNLILGGGILAYLSIIFPGLDSVDIDDVTFCWMCRANTWTLAIGFSIAFGAMFTKTWRVHRIFTTKTAMRTMIKDYQLYGMVTVLVILDIIVFGCREIFDPIILNIQISRQNLDEDVVLVLMKRTCTSRYVVYWNGSQLVLNGLLLIFGAFLAWETRKVTVPALNDSKYIGMSVYNVVVLSFVGLPVSLVLDDVNAHYAIIATFIFFATTLTLCMVFVPKLRVRNEVEPKGTMFSTMGNSQSHHGCESEHDKRVRMLSDRIENLQERLDKKDTRIRELESCVITSASTREDCTSVLSEDKETVWTTDKAQAGPSGTVPR
ncbi:gamma-aminobutyric acid type B receptor subunit 1-like [Diadema antillarum]|uniref:gamma-aminobutyric acid type B receptor subunit 1-like n=1 Tax=Diadema antillarum TaxID=105358 RepID=UPI003A8AF5AB